MGKNSLFKKWCTYSSHYADKMKLFTINHKLYPSSSNPLWLTTPLGDLFFTCRIFNESLLITQPTKVNSFESGVIASWICDNYIVEFIKFNFEAKLPVGMK